MFSNEKEGRPPGRQAARSEATRARLIAAARELFAARGYAAVGTEEVVKRAGVTRGALYHHFRDKPDLFRAVYEQVEKELVESIAASVAGISEPRDLLGVGVRAFLDACSDPTVMQIALLDGPAVLGWQEWREIGAHYGLGLMTLTLRNVIDADVLGDAEVTPLAHLLLGAMGEAALLVANADDRDVARAEVEAALLTLLDGLTAGRRA